TSELGELRQRLHLDRRPITLEDREHGAVALRLGCRNATAVVADVALAFRGGDAAGCSSQSRYLPQSPRLAFRGGAREVHEGAPIRRPAWVLRVGIVGRDLKGSAARQQPEPHLPASVD